MGVETLDQLLDSVESPLGLFRRTDWDRSMYDFPDEYTNWIEEQRAVQESCAIVDQSHHMTPLYVEGPDALRLLSDLGTNSFQNFEDGSPPMAKQLLMCNPDGYRIRDVVLFYLDEETFLTTGSEIPQNWIQYNLETGDYDAAARKPYRPARGETPPDFRFEVQGPRALEVMESAVDGGLPDVSFFEMDEVTIDGIDAYALGHGMAEAPGLEVFGSFDHHDAVEAAILEAGEPYGIRRMGSKAYKTGKIGSGWIQLTVPAIYDGEEMASYRRWLPADGPEARMSIGGSFEPDDVADYYVDPFDCSQGHLVSFDHDFVGREALERRATESTREKVTFVWDSADVIDVYDSLFREGESYKYIDLPDTARQWSMTHYDEVRRDGRVVGVSKYPGYLYYEREMLSLGLVEREYAEPGTEVTLVWGEEGSAKRRVERHVETAIRATVAPSPYVLGGRRDL